MMLGGRSKGQAAGTEAGSGFGGPVVVVGLALVLGAVVLLGPATQPFAPAGAYASLHLMLELPSVAISCAIFLFAWNTRGRDVAGWIRPIGAAFFATALLDTSHILAFPGMPGWLEPSTLHEAIALWLTSRFVAFVSLLATALRLGPRAGRPSRLSPLLAGAIVVGLWLALWRATELWPPLHHVGSGLTPLKVGAELTLVAIGLLAGVVFAWRARVAAPEGRRQLHWLAAASVTHAVAELAFTRFMSPSDVANFVGHLLKALGDLAVFQALFVAAVRAPFIRVQALREQQSLLLEAVPDPWVLVDLDGVILDHRQAAPLAFGLVGEPRGASLTSLMAPAACAVLVDAAEAARADGRPRDRTLEAPGPMLPGTFEVTLVPLRARLGWPASTLIMVRDVSETRAAEAQLRIADIAFEAPVALVVLDAAGTVRQVNRAFVALTGWGAGAVVGQPLGTLAADEGEAGSWLALLERVCGQQGRHETRARVHRVGGAPFHAEQSMAAVAGPDGRVTHVVMALRDLTSQRAAAEAIHRLAYFDGLTGLPNRRLLTEQLEAALRAARRSGVYGAVVFLDLDHFKTLNDTRGHDVGDRLLQAVSGRLAKRVRGDDLVARLGGDEFVVLVRRLDADAERSADQAKSLAQHLRDALREPFELPLERGPEANTAVHHTSSSIGISLFGAESGGIEELLKQADLAMYQAKDAGRNTLRFFDPGLQARLVRRASLGDDLRRAAGQGELWIAWQPQVDAEGAPIGAEALMRWAHPTHGAVSPVEFIPVAEDTGLIVDLGLWVIRSACATLARWSADDETRGLRISVNVSARQLYEPDFVERMRGALEVSGAPPGLLVLELTESMVLRGERRVAERLEALSALGVCLSMDDFGTGYSSLALLKRLPLGEVKIDRAFVRSLPDDADDAAIVHAILGIARGLGLFVVAEGVETAAQQVFLAEAGCPAFQGFRFAQPMALEALNAWVRAPRVERGALSD